MIGAIVGDIAGSLYEFHNIKTKDFPLFAPRHGHEPRPTDDSVMTLAVARALLDAADEVAALPQAAVRRMREFGRRYPHAGYGGTFFLLRAGTPMLKVWKHVVEAYYPLDFTLDEIRPDYAFDVSCQGSVPQALKAFFEADGFECAVRNAVSIGGDSDTIAAIAGAVAEARWGVPDDLRAQALARLDDFQRETIEAFEARFGAPAPSRPQGL